MYERGNTQPAFLLRFLRQLRTLSLSQHKIFQSLVIYIFIANHIAIAIAIAIAMPDPEK